MLKEKFSEAKVNMGLNFDTAVAYGACVYAHNKLHGGLKITDVMPFAIGTGICKKGQPDEYGQKEPGAYVLHEIMPKNSKRGEKKSFAFGTTIDGQEEAKLDIYEGENGEFCSKCSRIAEVTLKPLTKAPAGKIKITQEIWTDDSGCIHTAAWQELADGSGAKTEVHIESKDNQYSKA